MPSDIHKINGCLECFGEIFYSLGQKLLFQIHPTDFYWYFDPRTISNPFEAFRNNPTIGTSKLQLNSFWLAWDRDQTFIEFANLVPINGQVISSNHNF
ncbi:MAG: hypothetical protein HS131_06830 [Ignavibacteriales bacterium]|nr:hypothetical protein [Ignavibacteriales bacterium]